MEKNLYFEELSAVEMQEIDGGLAWFVVAGIVVGCLAIGGLGVYNGYKDTKDQK
ncbi:MAG: class IIb bacteriocin, lactobin A/cerein 7B family [Ruminococcus sp.]|nr:class IIb bacteriocin, lactobin A/cerein 7B family [Ruminococcus sp.]